MPATPSDAAPATDKVVESSAAETVLGGFHDFWTGLTRLDPGELALNLGLSAVVIAVVAVVVWLLRWLIHKGLSRVADDLVPETGTPRAAKLTWTLVRVSAIGAALIGVLSVWGIDLWGWLTSGGGVRFGRLVFVILAAVAAVEIALFLVNRLLARLSKRAEGTARSAQMHTLAPLIRGIVQIFVVVLASLMVLSELGVQIGPLLASAGVVGVAIGFGSQTLVKDFITGLFLVLEDIVAVGDNIRIGDHTGTVETMTLRTIRIRNMDGTLHILPYSEAQVIENRTKTYSRYVFDLGVGYGTDIDHALDVMRRVGSELQADAALGPLIQHPLEILGVDALGDSAVMLKAYMQTAPGQQWKVGRAYNKAIKEAFDAEGIEIPFPQRVVTFNRPEEGMSREDS